MMRRWSLRGQNRGASLIAVVVAMIFVATVGAIILAVTTTNIRMRAAETSAKRNFYSAEEIMNEISTGLNDTASMAMQQAYVDVLGQYYDIITDPNGNMQKAFQQAYMDELKGYFADNATTPMTSMSADGSKVEFELGAYDVDHVYQGWLDVCQHQTPHPTLGEFKATSEGGCFLTPAVDGTSVLMSTTGAATYTVDYVEGVFTLQNVKVRYTDPTGYETTINTDIAFHTPSLTSDQGIRNFMKYALIADEKIEMTMGTTINVNGSVYAGHDGIEIRDAKVDMKASNIVTRGDILVTPNNIVTIGDGNGRIWAENIVTQGNMTDDNTGKLILNGNIYVADDLTLGGKNTSVDLIGSYYGFNFQENYTGASPHNKSEFSSAIVLNGEKSTLDMTGLDNLYIAGRTFISRGGAGNRNADIPLGESLSVRTNQLAYNVPSSYLKFAAPPASPEVAVGWAGTPDGFNPATDPAPSGLQNYARSINMTVDQVRSRVDMSNPVATYRYKDYNTVVYRYYLNFKDDQSANDFFNDYWNANKTKMNAYGDIYADAIRLNDDGSTLLTLNGNLMYKNGTDFTEKKVELNAVDWEPDGAYYSYSDGIAVNYMALQMYLEDYHRNIGSGTVRFYDDAGKIDKSVTPLMWNLLKPPSEVPWNVNYSSPDSEGGIYDLHIVVDDGNYQTTPGERGLIIVTGDVIVRGNFTGTIISGGVIKFEALSTVTSDEVLMKQIFSDDLASGTYGNFTQFFVDNETGVIGMVSVADYVSYENWTRTQN